MGNFATSHAKREDPRVEAMVDAEGEREGRSYGVRLRLAERAHPPPTSAPIELRFDEARDRRGDMAWCQALASRIRTLARELAREQGEERRSA